MATTNNNKKYPQSDPRHHTQNIKGLLDEAAEHCRADVTKIDDPKAQALFETTAEVLKGLITAYDHFEQGSEPAWRR
ncbi:MAG: hypothetical protein QOF78_4431 [Phycisphaerales bacterium]|jgi:hypothetical protein|nr:hypothetical protein [Phycisphaerales bacterium]